MKTLSPITYLTLAVILTAGCLCSERAHAQPMQAAVQNLWKLPAQQEYDFTGTNAAGAANNNVRGVCINPVNGNVIYATRDGNSNHLAVVDGTTGTVLRRLSGGGVLGAGTAISLAQVRCAEDGVIYAASVGLTTGGSDRLVIYRWESDVAEMDPLIVFQRTGLSTRYGDIMDIRGAGIFTQIIMSGIGANKFALFTTADGTNFNDHVPGSTMDTLDEFVLPAGVAAGDIGKALSFDGTNNAFYAKRENPSAPSNLRYITFDPVAKTSALVSTTPLPPRMVGVEVVKTNGFIVAAGVLWGAGTSLQADQHRAVFYDITGSPSLITTDPMPAPYLANGNALGSVDIWGGKIAILEPGNGIGLYELTFTPIDAPSINAEPANFSVLPGGTATFSVVVMGTDLSYQWYFNTNTIIPNATNSTLIITNVQAHQAGAYGVIVTNIAGPAISTNAFLTVLPAVFGNSQAPLWNLEPGARPYLGSSDYGTRGIAYNPATGRLLVSSRLSTNIYVLDASTSVDLWTLDTSGIVSVGSPGTFALNMVGVADDGAVYACNLSDANNNSLTVYRWSNDTQDAGTNVATVAFSELITGPLGVGRLGDTLAVRGSGPDTQILLGTAAQAKALLLTTVDGQSFNHTVIDLSADPTVPTGFSGLGIAFGDGNTFWAKNSPTFNLRHVEFDPVNGTGTLLDSYPGLSQVGPIGVDNANRLLAGIAFENPDNLRLYDIAGAPVLLDQDFFPADQVNAQLMGSVSFDVQAGRIFALNVNNGLMALTYAPPLRAAFVNNDLVLTWAGPSVLQSSGTPGGTFTNVVSAFSPYSSAADAGAAFYRLSR